MSEDRERRLRDAQQRGEHAKKLLDDSLLNESFDFIEAKITKEWQEGDPTDDKLMKRCKDRFDSLRIFKMALQETLRKGEDAKRDLLELEKTSTLTRAFKR